MLQLAYPPSSPTQSIIKSPSPLHGSISTSPCPRSRVRRKISIRNAPIAWISLGFDEVTTRNLMICSRRSRFGFLGSHGGLLGEHCRSTQVKPSSAEFEPKKYGLNEEFGATRSNVGRNDSDGAVDVSGDDADSGPTSFEFLELKRELEESGVEDSKEGDLLAKEGLGNDVATTEEVGEIVGQRPSSRGRRQTMRRSNLLAKQVISIKSACNLGFVSQLWVDTQSWMVILVELRPNLLSGENEKFHLEDIYQVGDVVLVQDESIMENELKMVGLDTLVGYSVVTPGRQNIGKVRGYTFDINSGVVYSLELDSFGISIIPASLVSTYCLFIEDVLEVVSDKVIVTDDAISRVQRLTKGFWNTPNSYSSENVMGRYSESRRQSVQPVYDQQGQKNARRRQYHRRMKELEDDWEFPMDY